MFGESHEADTVINDEFDGCSEVFPAGLAYYTDVIIDTTVGNSHGETVTFYGSRNTDSVFTLSVTGVASFRNAIIGNDCKVNLDTSGASDYFASGASLKNGGNVTHASGQTINNYVYDNCDSVKPDGATMSGVTVANTTEDTTGGLELLNATDLDTLSGFVFNAFTGKYALYIPASVTGTITLNDFVTDGSGVDVYWAGAVGTLVINKANGTNFSTWSSAGGTVSIVSSVSIGVNVKDQLGVNIENALVYIDEDLDAVGSIINTTSDINGDVATSYSGVATTATIRVRLYGYKPSVSVISLLGDSSTNVVLITDPQQT